MSKTATASRDPTGTAILSTGNSSDTGAYVASLSSASLLSTACSQEDAIRHVAAVIKSLPPESDYQSHEHERYKLIAAVQNPQANRAARKEEAHQVLHADKPRPEHCSNDNAVYQTR